MITDGIINKHIQALVDLPIMQRESSTSMHKLVDDIQKHVRALRMMKADAWDSIVIHLLNAKLEIENSTRMENEAN